jgi:hypothetical protein
MSSGFDSEMGGPIANEPESVGVTGDSRSAKRKSRRKYYFGAALLVAVVVAAVVGGVVASGVGSSPSLGNSYSPPAPSPAPPGETASPTLVVG